MRFEIILFVIVAIATVQINATSLPPPQRKIVAKWVWEGDSKHTIVNYEDNDEWEENFLIPVKYTFKEYTNDGGVILYTDSIKSYARLSDNKVMYSRDIEDLRKGVFSISSPGSWEIKPKKKTPQTSTTTTSSPQGDILGKWVFKEDNQHYFVLIGNKWKEYIDRMSPIKYDLVEYTNGGGIILYSKFFNQYVKISNSVVYFNTNLDKLKQGIYTKKKSGHWEIKPKIVPPTSTTPKSTTTTSTKPPNDITGKWIFYSDNKNVPHYIVNKKNSNVWQEYHGKKETPTIYLFVDYTNDGGIIIYSKSRDLYAKLTDKSIFYHDDLDKLKKGRSIRSAKGYWAIKPKIDVPSTTPKSTTTTSTDPPMKLTGKWVFYYENKHLPHFLMNTRNSIVWPEYIVNGTRDKLISYHIFIDYTSDGGIIMQIHGSRVYAKVTDEAIFYNDDLDELKKGRFTRSVKGYWEIKPKIGVPKPIDTTPKLPIDKDVTGKWVFKVGSKQHYILNKKNSKEWQEINHRMMPIKYLYVEDTSDGGIIIYSKSRDLYAKLTDESIFYHDDLDELKKGRSTRSAKGRWEIKPDIDTSTPPLVVLD